METLYRPPRIPKPTTLMTENGEQVRRYPHLDPEVEHRLLWELKILRRARRRILYLHSAAPRRFKHPDDAGSAVMAIDLEISRRVSILQGLPRWWK
jgi:hypothetical protein